MALLLLKFNTTLNYCTQNYKFVHQRIFISTLLLLHIIHVVVIIPLSKWLKISATIPDKRFSLSEAKTPTRRVLTYRRQILMGLVSVFISPHKMAQRQNSQTGPPPVCRSQQLNRHHNLSLPSMETALIITRAIDLSFRLPRRTMNSLERRAKGFDKWRRYRTKVETRSFKLRSKWGKILSLTEVQRATAVLFEATR